MALVGTPIFIIAIVLLIGITIGLIFLTKNKSKEWNYKFILILMFANFALHFIKLAIPFNYYAYDLPISVKMIGFYNICAVSVLLFPWLFLFNNKYLNDYISIIGIISGFLAFIIIMAPDRRNGVSVGYYLAVLQYYLCHGTFFVCGVLMISNKLVKISYKRIFPTVVVGLLAVLTVIYVNMVVLKATGFVKFPNNEFSRNFMNSGYAFGIPQDMFNTPVKILDKLVPSFFKFTTSTGDFGYVPVIWVLFPLIIFGFVLMLIFMIFDRKQVKKDFKFIKKQFKHKSK